MDKKGGVSRFSVEKFLSHSAENFRRGIVYCCINFGFRKSLDKKGVYQDFLSIIFVTVPKISLGGGGNAIAAGRRGYFLQTLATQN